MNICIEKKYIYIFLLVVFLIFFLFINNKTFQQKYSTKSRAEDVQSLKKPCINRKTPEDCAGFFPMMSSCSWYWCVPTPSPQCLEKGTPLVDVCPNWPTNTPIPSPTSKINCVFFNTERACEYIINDQKKYNARKQLNCIWKPNYCEKKGVCVDIETQDNQVCSLLNLIDEGINCTDYNKDKDTCVKLESQGAQCSWYTECSGVCLASGINPTFIDCNNLLVTLTPIPKINNRR